jgi:hypothetical protein
MQVQKLAGRHRHTFGVSDLASGTYFLRLRTSETTRTASFRVVR